MSSKWNDDPFTKRARREDYKARSVYKLDEIDRREKILRNAKIIIDLGASPGSWTQYCLEQLKDPNGKIIAIDLAPLKISHPKLTFLQQSIEEATLESLLGSELADVVLSDMAPKTSGMHDRDVALSLELATLALETAKKHLKPGGNFVAKLFMGHGFEEYHSEIKTHFHTVSLLRPESTRKHSREIFFIAKGYLARR